MRTTIKLPYPRSDTDGTPLGINLSDPKIIAQVRKTLKIKSRAPHGYTYADWCQEMLLILWRRNHQPSAYDPRKGNLDTYITIVARSVSLKSEYKHFVKQPQLVYSDAINETNDYDAWIQSENNKPLTDPEEIAENLEKTLAEFPDLRRKYDEMKKKGKI